MPPRGLARCPGSTRCWHAPACAACPKALPPPGRQRGEDALLRLQRRRQDGVGQGPALGGEREQAVARLFRTPLRVAVATDSEWKSTGDLLAAAKAAQGKVNYGSWGVGSPGHLGGEQIEAVASVTKQHVP